MISVVIPLYNKELSIERTIRSVLSQTFTDFELIVVDDGSTDKSLEVVKGIDDRRIVVSEKINGGVSSARNVGLRLSRGSCVAFLDGDDYWLPWHLEVICNLINKYADVASIFATTIVKVKNIAEMSVGKSQPETSRVVDNYFEEESFPVTLLSSSSFAVKRDVALDVGGYDETLNYGEDVDFWYRVLKKNRLAKSSVNTAYYFVGAENRSDARVIPLEKRFHKFDFKNADRSEKKYLGKLVLLIALDYAMLGARDVSIKIIRMYWPEFPYVLRYFLLLVQKRLVRMFSVS